MRVDTELAANNAALVAIAVDTRYQIPAFDLYPDTREKEIMDLIADGFSDDEAGEKLFISSSTIRNALTGIYRKLGVENRTQATAAIWAGRKGETTF